MQVEYTKTHINHLKSKISSKNDSSNSESLDDYYFQILLLDASNVDDIKSELVYGTKKQLREKYKLSEKSLPTQGVELNKDFFGINDGRIDVNQASNYSLGRNLLQTRKLSQMMSYTWLDLNQDQQDKLKSLGITDSQIHLVRYVLNTYNKPPQTISWLDPDSKDIKRDYLIESDSDGYSAISLALLLAGQAYYSPDGQKTWQPIWPTIFGTTEIVRQYYFDINWNSYHGVVEEMSRLNENTQSPYYKATMGYPTKPDSFNVSQKNLFDWATAKETDSQDNDYPFYPNKNKDPEQWNNGNIEYVVPPFPYIPLSSS
ncbi:MAG: hypothetical protein F6K62_09545 [Sphaerospermopsis sp. SIO1G2]|nr:hypothetical protein [Sphaerospermopsis sp. SIO1G2]